MAPEACLLRLRQAVFFALPLLPAVLRASDGNANVREAVDKLVAAMAVSPPPPAAMTTGPGSGRAQSGAAE